MKLTVEQALQDGVAARGKGNPEDAERIYRAILRTQPAHPDANHSLGLPAVSVNKAEAALDANPEMAKFWLGYVDALIKAQQFEVVEQVLEQAKKHGVDEEKLNPLKAYIVPITQTQNADRVSPSQQQLNALLDYYKVGRHADAEKQALYLTKKFPKQQSG